MFGPEQKSCTMDFCTRAAQQLDLNGRKEQKRLAAFTRKLRSNVSNFIYDYEHLNEALRFISLCRVQIPVHIVIFFARGEFALLRTRLHCTHLARHKIFAIIFVLLSQQLQI